MKLKNKLTLSVAGVTLCTLAASFVSLGLLVRRDEIEDLDRALARQAAKAMARGIGQDGAGVVQDGWVEVPEILEGVKRHAALYDARGELLHATRSFEGHAPRFEELGVSLPVPAEGVPVDSDLRHTLLRGIVMQVPGSEKVLLYAVTRSAIDHDTRFLSRTLLALLLAATLIVVVIARWFGEGMAREVGSIAGVARSVARGDLHARIGARFSSVELNHLAADLDHMVAQLDGMVGAQQRFIAHAAHELRSPLSTLRGELQLALRRPREAVAYREALDAALLDVEALIALSEDLLTLARIQAAGPCDDDATLSQIVDAALSVARRQAAQASVQIVSMREAPAQQRVRGRTAELGRALRNLLDNAVAHSPPGGQVELDCWTADDTAYIAVSDHGAGIAEADRARIFEPFFRGSHEQAALAGGAGLGLFIAREIVQRSSGSLQLSSDSERAGACFVISLPLMAAAGDLAL